MSPTRTSAPARAGGRWFRRAGGRRRRSSGERPRTRTPAGGGPRGHCRDASQAPCYGQSVLAAYAAAVGGDDPLANLAVGDLPAPSPRPGWAVVKVRAASLNHHDIWTLRGVSSTRVTPPQILGCDAAGEVAEYGGEPPPLAPAVGSTV